MTVQKRAHLSSHQAIAEFDWTEGKPVSLEVFHGTTHDFDAFDISKHAAFGGAFGKIHYFTDSRQDALVHYAGVGPDLQARIDQRAETLTETIFDNPQRFGLPQDPDRKDCEDRANEIAHAELVGDTPRVLNVWIDLDRPFVINGGRSNGTRVAPIERPTSPALFPDFYDQMEAAEDKLLEDLGLSRDDVASGEISEEHEDTLMACHDAVHVAYQNRLVTALETAVEDFDLFDDVSFPNEIYYGLDSLTHDEFYSLLMKTPEFYLAESFPHGLVGKELIKRIIEGLGFDGIVLLSAEKQFPGMRAMGETTHIHVFESAKDQIMILDSQPAQATFDIAA